MYTNYKNTRKAYRKKIQRALQPPSFGKDMRDQEFKLTPDKTFLNHGSFGLVPNQIMEAQQRYLDDIENGPDLYYRHERTTLWNESLAVLCQFVGADPTNATWVENTTRGINNILKTLPYSAGDAILHNNWTYTAMQNTILEVARVRPDIEVLEIQHAAPIASTEEIVQQYRDMFDAHPNIKIALIDQMSSIPSVMFPVSELVQLCKERGVLSLIDGAHSIGHLPVNIEELQPDFYCGSLCKWLFTPRAAGIQWIAPQHQNQVHPVVTSNYYGTPFPSDYQKQGTRDDTALFTTVDSIEFYNWIGGMEAISAYNTQLLSDALTLLTEAWGTPYYQIPEEMECPFMRMLVLPDLPSYAGAARRLQGDLWNRFGIVAYTFQIGEVLLIRLSISIYCTMEDIEKLRDAILTLQDEEPSKRH